MVAAWPGTLPQSLSGNGDYQETPEKTAQRTSMDAGNIKSRKRFTRANAEITGSIDLTSAQVATFLMFFQTTIGGGSLRFTGTLSRTGVTETYMFKEDPTIVHIGGDSYTIGLKLLRLPV